MKNSRSEPRPRRLDWEEFSRSVRKPHGLCVRLKAIDLASRFSLTAEKRLLKIIRSHSCPGAFAVRRSFAPGPTVIECLFENAALADAVARAIGAMQVDTLPGLMTGWELSAEDRALRRVLKLGAIARPASSTRTKHKNPTPHGPGAGRSVAEESSDAFSVARSRLEKMSPEEQAAALFKSMTRNGGSVY